MKRSILPLVAFAALVGAQAVHAASPPKAPPASSAPAVAAPANDASGDDLLLPIPHGTPKQLITGGSRGVKPTVQPQTLTQPQSLTQPQAQSVMDLQPATPVRTTPRSLTGAR